MIFKQKKIGVISLGCDKNRVDTEKMLAILGAENITNDVLEAEVLIVNSCAFLESARKEALEAVFECDSYRQEGKLEKLILTGCLPQKFIDELFEDLIEEGLLQFFLYFQPSPFYQRSLPFHHHKYVR